MSEADKIWLTIERNNNYEVSNVGEIRNKNTKKVLRPYISNKGYYMISLSDKGKSHSYTIHKLVMEQFCRCAMAGEVINHIDGNKLNNNIQNLEYVTQKENMLHAWANNLCENVRKSIISREHPSKIKTSRAVTQIDLQGNEINTFVAIRDAERETGIHNSLIVKCCKGQLDTVHGYKFQYVEE
jgi:hypothetical protein